MGFRHFSQLTKDSPIDYYKEYVRLYRLFFETEIPDSLIRGITIEMICAQSFVRMPFRGTCIDLTDFNETHGFHFDKKPTKFDVTYLINFCEYTYNLTIYSQGAIRNMMLDNGFESIQFYMEQVRSVIDTIGYMFNEHGDLIDFVPKDQTVISVAEKLDANLSYKLMEYNHHSLKGDVDRKREILLALSNKIEGQRNKLKQNCASLESDLYFLFNKMNIRHNNMDHDGSNYVPVVSSMSATELERWYDDIYQMCLLAFMELDQIDRKSRIKELKDSIQ